MTAERGEGVTRRHIRESNLIEGIDDHVADSESWAAWQWLSRQEQLDVETVLTVHKMITKLQLGREAGRLRTRWVMVGGRVCPDPDHVPQLLDEWVGDMRKWTQWQPRMMHVWFEQIHPFIDGNGRTGRMLMWLHEAWLGLPPTLLLAKERFRYYEWFTTGPPLSSADYFRGYEQYREEGGY